MTEFSITAMFLLVPLFLLIPLVGKYIDIRHSTVQTARTMAWERTVWFEQLNLPRDAWPPGRGQYRSNSDIERVAMNRNLANTETAFLRSDLSTTLETNDLNLHWRDHGDNPLLSAESSLVGIDLPAQKATSQIANAYYILDGIQQVEDGINTVIDRGSSVMNSAAGVIGVSLPSPGNVDIFSKFNNQAYYTPEVRIPVNNISNLARFGGSIAPLANINLVMQGNAALITDGWSARNDAQFRSWSEDFLPTNQLKPVFDPIQNAVYSIQDPLFGIRIAPRTGPGILRFGEVVTSAVPASSVDPDCPGGLCSYE